MMNINYGGLIALVFFLVSLCISCNSSEVEKMSSIRHQFITGSYQLHLMAEKQMSTNMVDLSDYRELLGQESNGKEEAYISNDGSFVSCADFTVFQGDMPSKNVNAQKYLVLHTPSKSIAYYLTGGGLAPMDNYIYPKRADEPLRARSRYFATPYVAPTANFFDFANCEVSGVELIKGCEKGGQRYVQSSKDYSSKTPAGMRCYAGDDNPLYDGQHMSLYFMAEFIPNHENEAVYAFIASITTNGDGWYDFYMHEDYHHLVNETFPNLIAKAGIRHDYLMDFDQVLEILSPEQEDFLTGALCIMKDAATDNNHCPNKKND